MKEAPLKNLHQIVGRLVQALEVLGYVNDPARPLILFGHSFGAMQVRRRGEWALSRDNPNLTLTRGGEWALSRDVSAYVRFWLFLFLGGSVDMGLCRRAGAIWCFFGVLGGGGRLA